MSPHVLVCGLELSLGKLCLVVCSGEHEDRTDCVDPNSFNLIYDLCEGQEQCTIPDDTEFFGDNVCPNTYKYVNVTFVCICSGKSV